MQSESALSGEIDWILHYIKTYLYPLQFCEKHNHFMYVTVPFVPVDTVEYVETDGGDDTQRREKTHAKEQSQRDETQLYHDDGVVLRHVAPYNMYQ